jgi:hypothetical protein
MTDDAWNSADCCMGAHRGHQDSWFKPQIYPTLRQSREDSAGANSDSRLRIVPATGVAALEGCREWSLSIVL